MRRTGSTGQDKLGPWPGSRPSRCRSSRGTRATTPTTLKRTLDALEDLRLRLEDRFDEAPGEITVVVHPTPGWLAAAHPFLPLARLAAAPAGQRYLAGWAMATELHVLNDDYLERRSAGEDSRDALHGTAERLYAQIVIGRQQRQAAAPVGPARVLALPALGMAG